MGIPEELERRIASWEGLSRWERSEVGRDLRRLGLSYGEIRELINVKKSTLATWCRDIELSEAQKQAILERTGSRRGIPVDTQWRRREKTHSLQQAAHGEVARLANEPKWVAGVVLYWAEGNKTQSNLGLANSDPKIIRLFIDWFRRYHDPSATFALKLNLHAGNDEVAARNWWRAQSGLDDPRFHRTFIKPDGTGHRKNHLPHGVCLARMGRSADAFYRTLAWIDGLADHFDA